jgi:hypothetical protein
MSVAELEDSAKLAIQEYIDILEKSKYDRVERSRSWMKVVAPGLTGALVVAVAGGVWALARSEAREAANNMIAKFQEEQLPRLLKDWTNDAMTAVKEARLQVEEATRLSREAKDRAFEAANAAKKASSEVDAAAKLTEDAKQRAADAEAAAKDSRTSAENSKNASNDARTRADDAKKAVDVANHQINQINDESQKAIEAARDLVKQANDRAKESLTAVITAQQKSEEIAKILENNVQNINAVASILGSGQFEEEVQKAVLSPAFQKIVHAQLSPIPTGTIAYFNQEQCPGGWSQAFELRGRYAVGVGNPRGNVGKSIGQALEDGENRATGWHTHQYQDFSVGGDPPPPSSIQGGNSVPRKLISRTSEGPDGGPRRGTNAPYVLLLACKKE